MKPTPPGSTPSCTLFLHATVCPPAVGPAVLLPVATTADGDLAVRKKASRDHAKGEIRMAQLRRAVFVIGTHDGVDTGVVRVEADCRCEARKRAARLIVEGPFGAVVSADALSGNVE